MLRSFAVVLSALLLPAAPAPKASLAGHAELSYTADGKMNFPENYREWIYLTSGLGMSYSASASGHQMFDNVFVNPTAYKSFLATGTWPNKTVLVLEVRNSETRASIDQHGHSQTEVMGVEVHVRDEKLPGKWGFFEFDNHAPA
ncbi:MAG: cytochrome P460 family protein, partial [Acidobacteriota bacterium]|nr:cytochrome P460 family protein [Acidobacteriota bacterium]